MLIVYGTKTFSKRKGQTKTAIPCSHCNQTNPFVYKKGRTWFTLFWIPCIPLMKTETLTCPICDYGVKIKKKNEAELRPMIVLDGAAQIGAAQVAQPVVSQPVAQPMAGQVGAVAGQVAGQAIPQAAQPQVSQPIQPQAYAAPQPQTYAAPQAQSYAAPQAAPVYTDPAYAQGAELIQMIGALAQIPESDHLAFGLQLKKIAHAYLNRGSNVQAAAYFWTSWAYGQAACGPYFQQLASMLPPDKLAAIQQIHNYPQLKAFLQTL